MDNNLQTDPFYSKKNLPHSHDILDQVAVQLTKDSRSSSSPIELPELTTHNGNKPITFLALPMNYIHLIIKK